MYAMSEKVGEKVNLDNLNRKSDYFGPMVCGFTSGAVFKCTSRLHGMEVGVVSCVAGFRGSVVAGLIGMGVVAAIRFTQNTLLPKLGVSQRNAHLLFI